MLSNYLNQWKFFQNEVNAIEYSRNLLTFKINNTMFNFYINFSENMITVAKTGFKIKYDSPFLLQQDLSDFLKQYVDENVIIQILNGLII